MAAQDRGFISVEIGARLAGMKNAAAYKAIKHKKMPSQVRVIGKRKQVLIPTPDFSLWLQNEINRYEQKITHLKKSHKQLEDYMYGR